MWKRRIKFCLLAFLLASGVVSLACDREPEPPPVIPTPAEVPPPVIPATKPATTTTPAPPQTAPVLPAHSVFWIDNQPFEFAAAKLVLTPHDEVLRVTLFSDDPKSALDKRFQGNSYWFEFDMQHVTADEIGGTVYTFSSDPTGRIENSNGIFLAGGRDELQPLNATVRFEQIDSRIAVSVVGTFSNSSTETTGNTTSSVTVRAGLMPNVVAVSGGQPK